MLRTLALRAAVAGTVLASGLTASAALAPATAPSVSPSAVVAPAAPYAPLTLVSKVRKGPRLEELEFSTPYLEGTTKVRVLLPVGYDRSKQRWPVLHLLHGCCDTTPFAMGGFSAWTDKGDAEAATKPGRFLVVMPEAGGAGFYTDHYGYAGEGGPAWESYHIGQLLPWVDAHYRTLPDRAHRAVAGLSMGGFGSMSYASRHPDLFSFAQSYSGAVDPTLMVKDSPVRAATVDQALMGLDARPPQTAFGPWETEEVRTRMHGPVDLVGNLRHTVLTLRTGNGKNAQGQTNDATEDFCHDQTVSLHEVLARAGIVHTFDDYGTGGHTWDKWARGLKQMIAPLNAHFASGAGKAPASFTYTFGETRTDVYGYRLQASRSYLELTTLEVTPTGLTLSGSGTVAITTAPRYVPGARYVLTSTRNAVDSKATVTADRQGRLSFTVDTARTSTGQQFRAGTTTVLNQVQVAVRRA